MNQALTPPPPSPPPLSASQRLQAKVNEVKRAKDEENEQRNKDPVYLASKALQADQNKLKTEAANFERRSKLTAIAGSADGVDIHLAIHSDKNYGMSEDEWRRRLDAVKHLFVREPDIKGFVRTKNKNISVVGFLGTMDNKFVSLDLFALPESNVDNVKKLSLVARGYMTGNNDAVKFHLLSNDQSITCSLQIDRQRKHDDYVFVLGRELHSKMFKNSDHSAEDHLLSDRPDDEQNCFEQENSNYPAPS